MTLKFISLSSKISFFLFVALVGISTTSFVQAGSNADKIIEKARETVDKASPDDWEALAKSAKMCIDKNINLNEAAEWIEKSVSIKETTFNTKVMGDYYALSNLPEKAVEFYSKSIRIGKLDDLDYQDEVTQNKILKMVKLIG
jgi:hypothetical protein